MFEDGVAEALAEESFIADEDVGGAKFARLQFTDEALGLGEGAHQDGLSVELGLVIVGNSVCDSVFDCNIGESIRLGVAGCGNGYGVYLYARDPSLRLKNGSARDDAGEQVHHCNLFTIAACFTTTSYLGSPLLRGRSSRRRRRICGGGHPGDR